MRHDFELMAYKDYSKEEKHAFEKLTEDMKSGSIPGFVVLCGKEELLVDFYARRLIRQYVNDGSRMLDLATLVRDKVTVDEIIENLETMPFMSERKVVFLPEFFDDKGKMPKAIERSDSGKKALAEYVKTIDPTTTLLLMTVSNPRDYKAERSIKDSAIYKAAAGKKGSGRVYDFDSLSRRQLRGFIEKRFRAAGKQYKPGIISMIEKETGYESRDIDYGLYELNNDLKKIIAYCGDAPEIRPEDVSNVIGTNPEKNVFKMIDAITLGRKEEAFKLLHNLLADGESEIRLLAMIAEQLEIMLTACEMKDDGLSLTEIQGKLSGGYLGKGKKISSYRTKKALESGSRIGSLNLKRALGSAYDVEKNIKSGLMPGRLALEFFIGGF